MSLFGENLQFFRKRKGMTQEELAEKLEVSRQTISKWEAGTSYAEMEKILQLCDIFSCSMDTLLRKNAGEVEVEDNVIHRTHMRNFRNGITAGVVLCISSFAVYEILAGFSMPEVMLNTVFMSLIIVGVLIFVVQGIRDDDYKKKYPIIQDIYTEEEKEAFNRKFPVQMAVGIGLILIGMLIFGMNGDNLAQVTEMKEDFYYGIFLGLVAAAVGILVHSGMQKEEYDVEKYNKENTPDVNSKKISAWCGCIMLAATIVFLVTGTVFHAWDVCWLAYPVGGLLCGIVSLIANVKKSHI